MSVNTHSLPMEIFPCGRINYSTQSLPLFCIVFCTYKVKVSGEKIMQVSRAIVDAIEKEGITHVFMVPGGIVDGFTDELSKTPGIKTVVTAHEGGAIAMADGYSLASGKFGGASLLLGSIFCYAFQAP